MNSNSKQLSLIQIAKILKAEFPKMSQQDFLNRLLTWLQGAEPSESQRFNASSASRFFSDQHVRTFDSLLNNVDKASFEKVVNDFSDTSKSNISNKLNELIDNKHVYPSNLASILSKQIVPAINDYVSKTSSKNSSKFTKTPKEKEANKSLHTAVYNKVTNYFSKNKPNNFQFKKSFNLLVTKNPNENTQLFNISKINWDQIKLKVQNSPLLVVPAKLDPYSLTSSVQIPTIGDYTETRDGIILDEHGKPIMNNDNEPLKTSYSESELIKLDKAYIYEITSFKELNRPNNIVTIKVDCNLIATFLYNVFEIKDNVTFLGIFEDELYLNHEEHFRFIDNINFLERLDKILS